MPSAMEDFVRCIRGIHEYAPAVKVTGAISNILRRGLDLFDHPNHGVIFQLRGGTGRTVKIMGAGLVLICLTCDKEGIPSDPEKKIAIAKRIIDKADHYGVKLENLHIDPCVMTSGIAPLSFSPMIIMLPSPLACYLFAPLVRTKYTS